MCTVFTNGKAQEYFWTSSGKQKNTCKYEKTVELQIPAVPQYKQDLTCNPKINLRKIEKIQICMKIRKEVFCQDILGIGSLRRTGVLPIELEPALFLCLSVDCKWDVSCASVIYREPLGRKTDTFRCELKFNILQVMRAKPGISQKRQYTFELQFLYHACDAL